MNIQAKYPTTADEFLRWNEGREGKREFVRGKVVEMMINVTERHYRLAARLLVQLAAQLDPEAYIVGSADFGVRTGEAVRYPDVMVHRPSHALSLATAEPLLISEILSPSSMADDFGPKARDYLALESLQHYLVLSQSEVALWLWTRHGPGWEGPELHSDPARPLDLPNLGLTLEPRRLYAGIAGT